MTLMHTCRLVAAPTCLAMAALAIPSTAAAETPSSALSAATFTASSVDPSCGAPSSSLQRLGDDPRSSEQAAVGSDHPARSTHDDDSGAVDTRTAGNGSGAATVERTEAQDRLLMHLHRTRLRGIDGERMRCRGSGERVRELRWQLTLEQLSRETLLDGRTVLAAFEARDVVRVEAGGRGQTRTYGDDRLVGGTRVAELMELPPPAAWRAGDDDRSLVSSRRFRRATATSTNCSGSSAGRCSVLSEVDTTARLNEGALEIEQRHYLNGRLHEYARWRLAL